MNTNQIIDHIDNKPMDNRKKMLRIANGEGNHRNRSGKNRNNTSGYRNVSWNRFIQKWVVQLQVNGTNKILGKFDDVHEAGEFAALMRAKYYGEFQGKD